MDNYLDKKRFNNYYLMLAQREANSLQRYARQISSLHLKTLVPRLNFNNEIDKFIDAQIKQITTAKNERECKECLFNIREEKRLIEQQNTELKMGSTKIVVSAELVNKLDAWGYVINGVGVVLSGFQVIAGAGITIASITHGNMIGLTAGSLLILHGVNGLYEGVTNISTGRSDTTGAVKKGYVRVAEFMGFSDKAGLLAYSGMDLALSGYGLARQIMKADAWRLFRHLPSDFVRNYKNMSTTALLIEGAGDGVALKSIADSYKSN
ncbi:MULTISPECIES: DUF4225 domain-containing protein [Enterobacteriaceae]|uniref:DUF4225 domain-containing protein n=1 Tax=Enterobacteriaceae TaxID=543 RepID=UPI000272ABFB|nr:DUF4225 domain-containing protein [Enterobacter sp. Ag1]EJF30463.1 putative inner membrane protein [Enterobacter sp. Ag1]